MRQRVYCDFEAIHCLFEGSQFLVSDHFCVFWCEARKYNQVFVANTCRKHWVVAHRTMTG